jgi:hypothetical protein
MKLPRTGLRGSGLKLISIFMILVQRKTFIKLAKVRPTLEFNKFWKRKQKNQVKLKKFRAKGLADQLMTPPVETSATTVRPSVEALEVAEVADIPAAAIPSAKLVGGLSKGHPY